MHMKGQCTEDSFGYGESIRQEVPLTIRGQRGRCRNIKWKPQIFGSFPSPRPCQPFPLCLPSWWASANPICTPNLKLLAAGIAKILKENPTILGSYSTKIHVHFFFVWDFMMGLGKPQPRANFEVASFSRCRNIIGVLFWKVPVH